jgi:hypothetical protein
MITPEECMEFEAGAGSTSPLTLPKGIGPQMYFEFAVADLQNEKSQRSCVNALSNAKRALHLQVDIIAQAFGIETAIPGKRLSFTQKLEFCTRCGVVGPHILQKLNRVRNAMEHEYYIPSREEVEDLVDVAELFLAATDRFIDHFPCYIELSSKKDEELAGVTSKDIQLTLEPGTGLVEINLQQLKADPAEIHALAAEKRKELEQKIQECESMGGAKVDVLGGYSVKRAAYREAVRGKMEDVSFSVSATEGEFYFKWVSILVAGAR